MTTKQELINMMDNRLPGETLPIPSDSTGQLPAYPDLERLSYASKEHAEHLQQQQHLLEQAQPSMSQQVFTIQQPVISIQPAQFGARSHLAYCPSCHISQMTRCEYESSMMTHIVAVVLCFTTCCCCLPYCFDNCKSARHYCNNCGTYLGGHNK